MYTFLGLCVYQATGFNEFEPGLETVQPHILNQDTHKNRR